MVLTDEKAIRGGVGGVVGAVVIVMLGAALSLSVLLVSVARGVVEDRAVEVETEPTYPTTRYTIYQGGGNDDSA